eukprot:Skav212387  [mRNA]  locus=scaffold45:52385:52645:- [translate_table: standard]
MVPPIRELVPHHIGFGKVHVMPQFGIVGSGTLLVMQEIHIFAPNEGANWLKINAVKAWCFTKVGEHAKHILDPAVLHHVHIEVMTQ